MKYQKQKDKHQCLVTCFAMLENKYVRDLIRKIGHDGTRPVYTGDHPGIGHQPEEIICALKSPWVEISLDGVRLIQGTQVLDISERFGYNSKTTEARLAMIAVFQASWNGIVACKITEEYMHSYVWSKDKQKYFCVKKGQWLSDTPNPPLYFWFKFKPVESTQIESTQIEST